MRLVHTADWQIGKIFKQFGDKEPVLQQARLDFIESVGDLATAHGADHILVAGDLYDSDAPSPRTLLEPLERMKRLHTVQWHVVPGNHDPHRPRGVWDRVLAAGVPDNVHLHLSPAPFVLSEAVLLPAVLTRKSDVRDLTEWMNDAPSPAGLVRVGLAHGSVVGFNSDGDANNRIDPSRPEKANLDYLALGDWHRTMRIGDRIWYSGTPEPDRFGSQQEGKALVVDIPGPGARPSVTEHVVGRYSWRSADERVDDEASIRDLDLRLRTWPEPSCTALRLTLIGALTLSARIELQDRLLGLGAGMFWLDSDFSQLLVRPSPEDLERIDFDGVLRRAADYLKAASEDPMAAEADRKRAAEALVELYGLAQRERSAA